MSLSVYAQVDVELSRRNIHLGESSVLMLKVTGRDQSGAPAIPDVEGLRFQSRGTSRSTEIIRENNKTQRVDSTVYQWLIIPEKTGTFEIPSLQIVLGAKTYQSEALQLQVDEPGKLSGYTLVMQSEISEAIQWQPIPLKIVFYLSGKVGNLNFRIPFMENPSLRVIPEEPLSSEQDIRQISLYGMDFYAYIGSEILDGDQYTTLTIPMFLIPEERGSIKLEPSILSFDEEVGRDVLLRSQMETRSIISNKLSLLVNPVPEEIQQSANGFLFSKGTLQGEWNISPQMLRVGDPFEMELRLKGLILPEQQLSQFPEPSEFMKSMDNFRYLSEKRRMSLTEEGALQMSKNLRLISGDANSLPSQELVYYNIDTQSVEHLPLPAIPFERVNSSLVQQGDIETLGRENALQEQDPVDESPKISVTYSPEEILSQHKSLLWKDPINPLYFLFCFVPLVYASLRMAFSFWTKGKVQSKSYPWNDAQREAAILDSFKKWAKEKMDPHEIQRLTSDWERRMFRDQEDTEGIAREMTEIARETEK